jgi:hypothetical protein
MVVNWHHYYIVVDSIMSATVHKVVAPLLCVAVLIMQIDCAFKYQYLIQHVVTVLVGPLSIQLYPPSPQAQKQPVKFCEIF